MSPLSRRDLLRAGGAGAAGLAAGAAGYALLDSEAEQDEKAAREEPRNVVVVVIDNLRADHVGAYGSRRVLHTPSLDALAKEGLRFTAARPEAFPTVAARRAILTGRRSFPFRDWRATPTCRRARAGAPSHPTTPRSSRSWARPDTPPAT